MTKNKVWKLVISFAVAFALWLYVVTVVSPGTQMTFDDVEVRIMDATDLKASGLILTDYQKSVTVRLEGNRSDLNKLKKNGFTVSAYVAGSTVDDRHIEYSVDFPDSVAGNAIIVKNKDPEKLKIKVEKLKPATVPVVLRQEGSIPGEYTFAHDLELETDEIFDYTQIEIKGPESYINQIKYAVVTVDMEGRTQSVNGEYTFELCDENRKRVEVDPTLIDVVTTDTIRVNIPIYLVKDLPLNVLVNDGGGATKDNLIWSFGGQTTVTVAGPAELMENMKTLDVYTVEMKDLRKDETCTIALDEVLEAKGLQLISGNKEVTLTLKLTGLSTKRITLDADRIKISNSDYKLSKDDPLTIQIRGNKALIDQLTEQDITVLLKVPENPNGTQTVKPTVQFTEKFASLAVLETDPANFILVGK